jgi:hypothetical protein
MSSGIVTTFLPADAIIQSKPSSELLSQAAETVLKDQEKISSFILQMKSGDIVSQSASAFRARRLTYDKKLNGNNAVSTSNSDQASIVNNRRTSVFASTEIGVRQERSPPFPQEIMGTYSCHGKVTISSLVR